MIKILEIGRTFLKLFVDDFRFAGSIILWIVMAAWLIPIICALDWLRAPLFFIGLTLIFFAGTFFKIRRRQRS